MLRILVAGGLKGRSGAEAIVKISPPYSIVTFGTVEMVVVVVVAAEMAVLVKCCGRVPFGVFVGKSSGRVVGVWGME